MNELESILNYLETTSLEPHDDYTSEFTYKEQKLLWNYIKQLKEQLERSEKARLKCLNKIKTLGKFDGENFTRSFTLWSADFNELAKMLDIDKGE